MMTKEKTYQRIPVEQAKQPAHSGTWEVYLNYWWAVTENNEILVWRGVAPACNMDQKLVEGLLPKEANRAVQIEAVYLRHNPSN